MRKKIFYVVLILSLMMVLPAFSGNAIVSPEDFDNTKITTDGENPSNDLIQPSGSYQVDDTTIDVIEISSTETHVILNDTHRIEINQSPNVFQATFYEITPPGLFATEDSQLLDVTVSTNEISTSIEVILPSGQTIILNNTGEHKWEIYSEELKMDYNGDTNTLIIYGPDYLIAIDENVVLIDHLYEMDIMLEKVTDRWWMLHAFAAPMLIEYYPTKYYAPNDNLTVIDDLGIPIALGPIIPFNFVNPTGVTFTFQDEVLIISYLYWSVAFYPDMIVIHYYHISIIIYFDAYVIVARIVILIFDLTFIFYFINIIIDLYLVIIYYDYEIKFYYSQTVIVYQSIEIIIVFISIYIWEITIIWHINLWIVQIIFLIQLNVIIVQPVRFILIPVVIPIFIPIIYYVPVFIKQIIHVYIPYAALQVYIDVYDEDLKMPTHTIQYFVYDQTGAPIDDATVNIDYNGTIYPASFISNGIYQVQLPASDEVETISVTATKPWYPNGVLTYDLEVDWIIETIITPTNITVTETETPTTPLYIVPILSALFLMAIGTVLISRKKKK
ncbi:MAG: hypothetical protein FK731_09365 [Asgard group archaeon]|nr:hypothetical protein [Asgard group archaeon]